VSFGALYRASVSFTSKHECQDLSSVMNVLNISCLALHVLLEFEVVDLLASCLGCVGYGFA
jgi:hypothetical protein